MSRRCRALRGCIVALALAPGCGTAADENRSSDPPSDGTLGGETTSGSADGSGDDTQTGGTLGSTSSSTGAMTSSDDDDDDDGGGVCTDGQVDEGEACDDGNMVQADGCNNDCILSGSLSWEHTHASGLGATDEATGVAVDEASDAYVVGWVATEATGEDIWLRRYGEPGAIVWTRTVDGPASGNDRAHGISLGPDGSLFVVGQVATVGAGTDVWVARYDAGGNQTWATTYGGAIGGNDQGRGVAADGSGVVVTGFETVWEDELTQGQNIWVRKYDAAGSVAWTAGHGGAALGNDVGLDVAVDSSGHVIVVGYETVAGAGRNMWIRKYDPSGAVQWTRAHDGPESSNDEASAVAVDNDDEILVAGFEGASAFPWRWWLRRYDASGAEMWTRTYEGATREGARATGVSATGTGIAVVTGIEREDGHDHGIVRKYGPDGFELWTTAVRGIDLAHHVASATAIDDDGRCYAVGGLDKGVDGRDAWTGRFAQ